MLTIIVSCAYCGSMEAFSGAGALEKAVKWIEEDLSDGFGHSRTQYSVYIGKKVKVDLPKIEAKIII